MQLLLRDKLGNNFFFFSGIRQSVRAADGSLRANLLVHAPACPRTCTPTVHFEALLSAVMMCCAGVLRVVRPARASAMDLTTDLILPDSPGESEREREQGEEGR